MDMKRTEELNHTPISLMYTLTLYSKSPAAGSFPFAVSGGAAVLSCICFLHIFHTQQMQTILLLSADTCSKSEHCTIFIPVYTGHRPTRH